MKDGMQSAVQTANHFINSVNWPCVSGYTGAGMAAGGTAGASAGLAGIVTGPGEVVIEPASIVGGAAIGGAAGLATGLNSCMSSNGGTGGGGSGESPEVQNGGVGDSSKPPVKATKLRGSQGWRDEDGNIWKRDMLHKDHWDVSDRAGNKIKEITFDGRELWPNGPKKAP